MTPGPSVAYPVRDPAGAAAEVTRAFEEGGIPAGRYELGRRDCVSGACAVAGYADPTGPAPTPTKVRQGLGMRPRKGDSYDSLEVYKTWYADRGSVLRARCVSYQ